MTDRAKRMQDLASFELRRGRRVDRLLAACSGKDRYKSAILGVWYGRWEERTKGKLLKLAYGA